MEVYLSARLIVLQVTQPSRHLGLATGLWRGSGKGHSQKILLCLLSKIHPDDGTLTTTMNEKDGGCQQTKKRGHVSNFGHVSVGQLKQAVGKSVGRE